MEKSELIPEDKNSNETSSEINNDEEPNSSVEFLEKSNFQEIVKTSGNSDNLNSKAISKNNSLFNRVLENGFDGITTNPNYKLLALLIILLINLSLFFVIGNIGKTFLRDSGILS